MALKTFNLDAEVYKKFSEHCKREGISMSRQVEKFIREELEKLKAKTGVSFTLMNARNSNTGKELEIRNPEAKKPAVHREYIH